MSSIFSVRPLFRSRNPARNYNTDLDRLMTIKRSVEAGVASAISERDGLQRRVDLYYAQATNLLDNSGEFGERSSADESSIKLAERNAGQATQRIRDVSAQIDKLQRVLAEVETLIAELHPVTDEAQAASG
ncbi:hypothetical protein [Devosia lacusdianchii]|jgi:hypothetical protein|uniref:hypothetical protein n=1 Tax=Devosia lacusdianchii TaxID=2917991 RepID=UPI001F066D99|nr:hypothetical protein [Devosia sp. JXJ CY 41]